jgi:hypothetical protein
VNDAYIAMTNSQELRETLFFAGFDYVYEKQVIRGTKTYIYTTPKFVLTLQGRNIYINDEKYRYKYRYVSDARKFICERFMDE